MIYNYVSSAGLENEDRINELDIALMSVEELVAWVGGHVGWFDAYFLVDSLEELKPGVRVAYSQKYGPPKGMEGAARDSYYKDRKWEVASK